MINNRLDSLNSAPQESLDARLSKHPELRQRFHALVDVVDAAAGDCRTAAQAEARVLEEIRQMGLKALSAWSERAEAAGQIQVRNDHSEAVRDGKKNSTGIPASEKFG